MVRAPYAPLTKAHNKLRIFVALERDLVGLSPDCLHSTKLCSFSSAAQAHTYLRMISGFKRNSGTLRTQVPSPAGGPTVCRIVKNSVAVNQKSGVGFDPQTMGCAAACRSRSAHSLSFEKSSPLIQELGVIRGSDS